MRREPDWRLPDLWRHEFMNVLATYARQGGATLEQARVLWRRAVELFGPREHASDAEAALGLAVKAPVSAYDGQYVALAQRLQTILVTEDRRLLKAFPETACSMQAAAASFPGL